MLFKILLVQIFCILAHGIKIITKDEWGGRPATEIKRISEKLSFVIIHHSYEPSACYTTEDCKRKMRAIQDMHQLKNGWHDIGYSFVIGGDGRIYEGRGFNVVGAHAPNYNKNSVGICLMGDWRTSVPPKIMLKTTHDLIDYGVQTGHIKSNYTLFGHRQVKATECPGEALFKEIQKWPHFSNKV